MATYDDIINKLDYLDGTKQLIKSAIRDMGQAINDEDAFRLYVDRIKDIINSEFTDASELYTETNTVDVNSEITIDSTILPNVKLNSMCLISYKPETGTDLGLEGTLLVKSINETSLDKTLIVLYKYVSSGNGQVKLYENIDDMNNDTNVKDDGLAIIYSHYLENMKVDTQAQYFVFPKTVTLSSVVSDVKYVEFKGVYNTEKYFDGFVTLDSSRFEFTGYNNKNSFRILYTSNDGITYINTSDVGSYDFGIPIYCLNAQDWDDNFGHFMQVDTYNFGGLYQYDDVISSTKIYSRKNISYDKNILFENSYAVDINDIATNLGVKLAENVPQDLKLYSALVVENENIINCYAYVNPTETICNDGTLLRNCGLHLENNNVYITFAPGTLKSDTHSDLIMYKWTIDKTNNTVEVNKMMESDYIKTNWTTYVRYCLIDTITPSDSMYVLRYNDSGFEFLDIGYEANSATGYIRNENVVEKKYILAKNQYTLNDSNLLLSNTLAYGTNGNIIGSMPNNNTLEYVPLPEEQIIPSGYTSGGTIASMYETDEYKEALALTKDILGI